MFFRWVDYYFRTTALRNPNDESVAGLLAGVLSKEGFRALVMF